MNAVILFVTGVILSVFGSLITVAFWVPRLVNKKKLKELLGSKYPLVYIIYIANGPLLLLLGLLLAYRFR